MKTSPLKIHALILSLPLLPVVGFGAQPAATPARVAAPLGLSRLQDTIKPGEAGKLVETKFAVDALPAGFRTAKRLAQGSDNGLPIFLANCRAECQERVG